MRTLAPLVALLASVSLDQARAADHVGGVDLLVGYEAIRDDLLVPWAFQGPDVEIGGHYLGRIGPGLAFADLRAGAMIGWNHAGQPALSLEYGVHAGWLGLIGTDGPSVYAVGPVLGADGDMFYLESWDDAHGYWLGAHWLGVAARGAWPVGRHRIDATARTSLLGWYTRPPEYRYDKQDPLVRPLWVIAQPQEDGTFGWLADWQSVEVTVEVREATDAVVPRGRALGVALGLRHTAAPATAFAFEVTPYASWSW